jgi:hypothetical protein
MKYRNKVIPLEILFVLINFAACNVSRFKLIAFEIDLSNNIRLSWFWLKGQILNIPDEYNPEAEELFTRIVGFAVLLNNSLNIMFTD